MKLSVIGCGYLGAVHAACMADLGHDVVGIDVDVNKVRLLAERSAPSHELGFEDVNQRVLTSGRLWFTTEVADAAGPLLRRIRPELTIDGRNALGSHRWRDAGWTYVGLGRL